MNDKEKKIERDWLCSIFFDEVLVNKKEDFEKLCECIGNLKILYGDVELTCQPLIKEMTCSVIANTSKNYRSLPETCDVIKLAQELNSLHGRLINESVCVRDIFYWLECIVEDNACRHAFNEDTGISMVVGGVLEYTLLPEENYVRVEVKFTDKKNGVAYLLIYVLGHPMTTKVSKHLMLI